jgi:hypothetical protein
MFQGDTQNFSYHKKESSLVITKGPTAKPANEPKQFLHLKIILNIIYQ